MVLDMVELSKRHTGYNLAQACASVLKEFGIADKVIAIACDNASNNDTMVTQLSKDIPAFQGATMRVQCFAHILNLVVKSVLHVFEQGDNALLSGVWEDLETEEGDDEKEEEDDNIEDWQNETEDLEESERDRLDASIQPVKSMLGKVRPFTTVQRERVLIRT